MASIENRFQSKVALIPFTECHEWIGTLTKKGYGQLKVKGANLKAHRLAYELYVGDIGEFHVLHQCDNRSCVNPKHLFLGTNEDNHKDKIAKNRQHQGKPAWSKLSVQQVLQIRNDFRPHHEIALEYGVVRQTISAIKSKQNWGAIEWLK